MKRILIISPGPFSKTDNDGQTLEDFFYDWDHEDLAQLYISAIPPDMSYCKRYLNITDADVFNLLFRRRKKKRTSTEDDTKAVSNRTSIAKKTPITMLLRDVLWSLSPWETSEVKQWISSFDPEVLFFEIGDNAYLMNYVLRLKRNLKVPLVVHNTEGYYLFEKSYLKNAGWLSNLFYPIWHSYVKRSFAKVMKQTDHVFYSCGKLQEDYNRIFPINSSVVYKSCTSPQKEPFNHVPGQTLKISYAGNLGYDRAKAIIEVANCLKMIDTNLCIDVYGRCNDQHDLKALLDHENINYHGFVPIEVVRSINHESDVLLHVESHSCAEEVKYGFSTKIPDSLGSGNVFFLFAPKTIACAEYLEASIPEIVASDIEEMRIKLLAIVSSSETRNELSKKCLQLCEQNHNRIVISEQIRSTIYEL